MQIQKSFLLQLKSFMLIYNNNLINDVWFYMILMFRYIIVIIITIIICQANVMCECLSVCTEIFSNPMNERRSRQIYSFIFFDTIYHLSLMRFDVKIV